MTAVIPEEGSATVSLARAGQILGCSRSKAYRLHKDGEFPVRTVTIGATVRVPVVLLERFLLGDVEAVAS